MSTPEAPHDVNFCFPVGDLENERVKLTPFIPSKHTDLFFEGSSPHPELYRYLPFGPFASAASHTHELIHGRIAPDPAQILYAIIDKTRTPDAHAPTPTPSDFAGTIGYLNASPAHLNVEIGFMIVLPAFQRTHVTTNAVGLLLHYALDLPGPGFGLGLRRVQWQAHAANATSVRVAERMGLRKEAVLRWDRVLPGGKEGNGEAIREGDPRPGTLGRDTMMLAICWDDWEDGGRDRVAQLMDRRN